MFTGLVETIGSVDELTSRGNYYVMTVRSSMSSEQLRIGESIACQGVCLTVIEKESGTFSVELSQETAARVDLSRFRVGSRINLERAMQLGDRLGGHLVSGHIDTTGTLDYLKPVGRSLELAVSFDRRFDPLVIDKGSIAIDGVSLTVNESRSGWLSVNLIPHTGQVTTLSELKAGGSVNLEFDLVGKYIVRYQQADLAQTVTEKLLRESGW